jgi:hypothetical protein
MDRVTGYTDEQRRVLRAAFDAGVIPNCPTCGGPLMLSDIEPRGDVAYVRHRGWVRCPACRRTTAIDLPEALRGRNSEADP